MTKRQFAYCYVCRKPRYKWDNPDKKGKYCSRKCLEWKKKYL